MIGLGSLFVVPAAMLLLMKPGLRAAQPRVIRVGMQASPPWYSLSAQGEVYGPVVDIVNEAARRGGVQIEWKPDPLGPEHALVQGDADLWPLMGRLPTRLGRFAITESWLDLGYTLVTLDACGTEPHKDAAPAKIARRDSQAVQAIVAQVAHGAKEVVVPTHTAALEALCTGQADAAVIAELLTTTDGPLVPASCLERNLCLTTKHLLSLEFGIGARPGSSGAGTAAKVLRTTLDAMIDDGTLAGILLKWGVPSGEIRALRLARLDRARANILLGITVGLVLLVGVLVAIYRRLLRTSKQLRRANEELQQSETALKAEYERRVEVENSLHQAQKMESIGRLAGGVAHDFNNMLTVILGYSAMLKREFAAGSEPLRRLVQIEKAADRSKEMTRQLLGFSRQQVIAPVPSDLNALLNDLMGPMARLVGEDVELGFYPGEGLWTVVVDTSQVNQILMNLVVNARDAMPLGGKLTIETKNATISPDYCVTHAEARPGAFVVLSVSDNGVGIQPEILPRVFEPFFTTKPKDMGTGLGLSMIYGTVRQNGGFVNVYSEPGQGTTFHIYLPRMAGAPEDSVEAASDDAVPRGAGNVLVVEDDELVRNLVTVALKTIGYTPVIAESPAQALEVCASEAGSDIRLVLTDVVMPGMNGMELRRRICEVRPGMRVLFMSGYTSNVIVKHGILKPGVHFIQKPFTVDELSRRIDEVLG